MNTGAAITAAMQEQKRRDQWTLNWWVYCRIIRLGVEHNGYEFIKQSLHHLGRTSRRYAHLTYDPFTFKSRRF